MKKFTLALATLALSVASMNAADYYLIGGFNGWTTADPAAQFTETAQAGVYELKYDGTLTSGFKVNDGTWNNPDINFGSNGSNLVVGEPYKYAVGGSTANIDMAENVKNPTVTLNLNDGTLLVVGEQQEAKTKYGIHGEIFGDPKWSTEEMSEENGKWVLSNASVVPGGFGIKAMDADNGSQTGWYSSADDGTVTLNTPMAVKLEGTNWTSDLTGSYSFTYDPDAQTLLIASASLWNDITADENATFAIYTIEGNIVKASANIADVENLESGMYIINGEKVMICK